jgi:hypothetical protein
MSTASRAAQRPPAESVFTDKVRKLLAMAEGTSNAAEADAFSRKAAELIALHRIDPERLRPGNTGPLEVLEVPLGRGAYVRARLALLQAVAAAHGCRVVFRAGYEGTIALVAGFRQDLSTVDMVFTSLHAQAAVRMANERRSTGAATQRWRRSFLFGYADQVRKMLVSSEQQAEATVTGSASTLPARQARDRQVEEFASSQFGRVVTARPAARLGVTGYTAGRAAATTADVGRRRVSEQPALGQGG